MHRWGCACAECTGRAARQLREAQAVREHNRRALAPGYYQTGPRVTAPGYIRPHEIGPAFDMHYAYDWMGRPKDVP